MREAALIRIRNPQDFAAGLFFILVGAGALYALSDLRMGTALRMGPAYVPTLIAWAVMAVGALVLLGALIIPGPSLEKWAWRPLFFVCGATAFFGVVVGYIGLVLAGIGIVVIACLAVPGLYWGKIVAFAVIISLAAAGLFSGLLGLPLRLWPW